MAACSTSFCESKSSVYKKHRMWRLQFLAPGALDGLSALIVEEEKLLTGPVDWKDERESWNIYSLFLGERKQE